jgi:predicted nucleic acid-binding protein
VILVDTSVWVDHLRKGESLLAAALEKELVLTHPFIIGELACGNIRNRTEFLDLIGRLPEPPVATDKEVLELIVARKLSSKGIGYIDTHLLASTLLMPNARLWTKDRQLSAVASILRVNYTA